MFYCVSVKAESETLQLFVKELQKSKIFSLELGCTSNLINRSEGFNYKPHSPIHTFTFMLSFSYTQQFLNRNINQEKMEKFR